VRLRVTVSVTGLGVQILAWCRLLWQEAWWRPPSLYKNVFGSSELCNCVKTKASGVTLVVRRATSGRKHGGVRLVTQCLEPGCPYHIAPARVKLI
jgi:hypothetical protein